MVIEFNGEDVGLESRINTMYLKTQRCRYIHEFK